MAASPSPPEFCLHCGRMVIESDGTWKHADGRIACAISGPGSEATPAGIVELASCKNCGQMIGYLFDGRGRWIHLDGMREECRITAVPKARTVRGG